MIQRSKSWAIRLLALCAVVSWPLIWYLNTPRIYVQRVLYSISSPPGSSKITQEIHDWSEGPDCPYAELVAFYRTDKTQQDRIAFYTTYLTAKGWVADEKTDRGLSYHWPYPDQNQILEVWIYSLDGRDLQQLTPAIQEKVSFTIRIRYIPDVEFFTRSHLCQD